MYPGTPEEQKIKLAEEITSVIMKIVNKPEGAVSVSIDEAF
jgi:phenylpyruvate tautomerase PptA (4-oxalocrotonate tautomerase family)